MSGAGLHYGGHHRAIRNSWAPKVAAGLVDCWRCGDRIYPGEPWHLGHDDHDRRIYRGPEHERCNCGATAAMRGKNPKPRKVTKW